jgi:hypothetical protein
MGIVDLVVLDGSKVGVARKDPAPALITDPENGREVRAGSYFLIFYAALHLLGTVEG